MIASPPEKIITYNTCSFNYIRRGQIYLADMSLTLGSEQGGIRYVCVIGNNLGNIHSPTVEVCCITSQLHKPKIPTHIQIDSNNSPLPKTSIVMTECKRTIDKSRLMKFQGTFSHEIMSQVDNALLISLGLKI